MTARTGARSRTGSNPAATCRCATAREDGLWVIADKRQVVYGRKDVAPDERLKAAEKLKETEDRKAAELAEKFKAAIERQ